MSTGGNLRDSEIEAFLAAAGWGDGQRQPLNADASTRRYERLRRGLESAMLMDAPVLEAPPCPVDADDDQRMELGWNAVSRLAASRVEAFVAVARWLCALGLSAPEVRAQDTRQGFALLEDLGDDLYTKAISRGASETELYSAAAAVLARVHREPVPSRLPFDGGEWPVLSFDYLALTANVDLFAEWAPQRDVNFRMSDAQRLRWERVRESLIARAEDLPRAMILRDVHAENLIWLPKREGLARVGLLDFQDAVLGWGEWDMSMLLQDARRDVSPEAREAAITAYLDGTGGNREAFDERLSILGAMNLMRIVGIFSRLVVRDHKTRYDEFQPRTQRLLAQSLDHPALAEARAFIEAAAPHMLKVA